MLCSAVACRDRYRGVMSADNLLKRLRERLAGEPTLTDRATGAAAARELRRQRAEDASPASVWPDEHRWFKPGS
jgi:hypothetical protein